MAKVGPFVTDPKVGAYCQITLDSGEKILVNHDQGGFKGGWLRIERVKLLGFSSDSVFECNLDTPEGKAALGALTRGVAAGSADATPLGAFVRLVTTCRSVNDLKARCTDLLGANH
jgi:hypothetical protein